MTDSEPPQSFRTLRGFIEGEEPDEPTYFAYSATLRIFGVDVPFDEITSRLDVQPTHWHRKGDRRGPRSKGHPHDAWMFQPDLPETSPLEEHIAALWNVVKPEVDYVRALKDRFSVDVFCGYRSNCDHAGFEVSHTCLELFIALEIPFGVSVIIA